MIAALKRAYNSFRGFEDYAFSVPPLDGAFLPNSELDDLSILANGDGVDNLIAVGQDLYCSQGTGVFSVSDTGALVEIAQCDAPITALCATTMGGMWIAVSGGDILHRSASGDIQPYVKSVNGGDVTAMVEFADQSLGFTIGARGVKAMDWQCDFLRRGRTGSAWIVDRDLRTREVIKDLAWPNGIAEATNGNLVISQAWDHSLISLTRTGQITQTLENLPGYPGRIIADPNGGYWVSFVSIRNQLVEFVLRERTYVARMMSEIDREFWVCPMLYPPRSPLSVMQAGAERHHGEMKPWAPSLSYGLIARVSDDLLPQMSLHSRANGNRHGITSLAMTKDGLFASTYSGQGVFQVPMKEGTE